MVVRCRREGGRECHIADAYLAASRPLRQESRPSPKTTTVRIHHHQQVSALKTKGEIAMSGCSIIS
jgi:hypothetical protein